jgi:ParB family chromosome partitioning protein
MRALELSQLSLRYAGTRIQTAARRARLVADLAQHGQRTPVLVYPDAAAFVLVDGYARVEALRALGEDLVQALVLDVSATEALLMAHRLQTARRRSGLEEAWLLDVLIEEHGLRPHEVASKLARSPSWVSRRLGLIKILPQSVQDEVRRGALCPQAAMKALVPLARANAEQCAQLVAGLAGTHISVREWEQIYRGWRRGDATVRQRIVDQPQLFLRASQATPDKSPPAQALRELSKQCEGCAGLLDTAQIDDPGKLRAAWAEARRAFEGLRTRMDGLYA